MFLGAQFMSQFNIIKIIVKIRQSFNAISNQ